MSRDLEGKVAIVTGAGRGIGQALALALAESGVRLVINDLDQGPLEQTASEANGDPIAIAGSVTDPNVGQRLTEVAVERFGCVDIVATCAGYTWDVMFHRMTVEQWQSIIDVHLGGTYHVVHPAYQAMRKQANAEKDRGDQPLSRRILTVSSMSSFGNSGQANYSAAKAGIVGLTRTIALEGAAFNILANTIAFGPIDTRMTRPRESQSEMVGGAVQGIPESARVKYFSTIPMGRPGKVAEAVGPMMFLLSSAADYVSGSLLEVNGAAHIS
jgi:3-oxoacyl-[acyl-carrier protein] reductase